MSTPSDPVEITGTSTVASPVPRRISAPFPNCFSISPATVAIALSLWFSIGFTVPFVCSQANRQV
jgi:hypothetical protein